MAEEYNKALKDQLESESWNLAKNLDNTALGYATLGADIAGIFDPTPVSDTAGALLSLAAGDFLGAGLSVASYIPYVGDAVAKPAKWLNKYGKKAEPLVGAIKRWAGGKTDDMAKFLLKQNPTAVHKAREAAAKKFRELQKKKLNGSCNTKACAKINKPHMPDAKPPERVWNPPNAKETGDGTFTFKDKNGNMQSVEYKDGYAQFPTEGPRLHIDEVSGNASTDAGRLIRENPDLFPDGSPGKNFTLHHFEDGTVGFVDKALHDKTQDGLAHSGFASMQKNDIF